ncbi:peptidoglycan glycosyltransferase [Amycolatopsis sulphurea]|uniref:Peptidoglycan glycosyltransferase n=1 Tax=Amycolatopsis sulphurea TaxID=76022 RepID=A0A2A9FAT1_9PSEU|nr:penicillin-binding transpeptidase domain-containing protein [Amycolatopsis sulphurea]PFG48268.1 peptidoglycan glycosyltransferase [Amycolatopsis sulphurea]
MNTPLRKVGMAMLLMIVLLLANDTFVQVIKADTYRTDSRNRRVLYDEYSRQRGQLVAPDGTILAGVKPSGDKLNFTRNYTDGAMYAPVTGYYSINYGAGGMERIEDDVLNGSDPRLFVRRLSDMVTGRDPRGGNVKLTVDPKVQKAAYDLMTKHGYTGSVVAMEPKTGRILAMVSTPSYDPNALATHNGKEQNSSWDKYSKDKAQPMLNRAINENYPPGSTFKLVTASAALEAGIGPDTQVSRAPNVQLPGTSTTLENYGGETCPGTTFKDALAHSCNVPFATFSGQLGADKMKTTAANFGIGQSDLAVPLKVAPSTVGPLDSPPALYQSGIGQRDVRLTPLQDCLLSATVANGGMAMKPQLVQSILAPDLSTIEDVEPEQLTGKPALSPDNAKILTDMMISSESFTAGNGKNPALKIASKTGTAEHGTDSKNTPPHAWYTAFAPADNPQIAVSVIVENGGNRGLAATGGSVAAEIGRAAIAARLGGG